MADTAYTGSVPVGPGGSMVRGADDLMIARAWMRGMEARDASRMGSYAAEDVSVLEVAEGEAHQGRDYLVWAYEDLFTGYPDCTCEIINEFAGDGQVLMEVQWRGTETGPFRGQQPTGGTVDIRIAYIFKVAGGRITSVTEYYDAATLVKQLEQG
jgi:steroid delta-isomerase-like uncharacterized protein